MPAWTVEYLWTFEAWIYPTNVSDTNDYAIVAQCRSFVAHTCLHLVIRNQKLYFGLYGDDVPGNTVLTASRWYHVAFAFDCATRAQSVYLNGRVDGSGLATMCFQGYNQSLTTGITEVAGAASCFAGLIDQLLFSNRTKTVLFQFRPTTDASVCRQSSSDDQLRIGVQQLWPILWRCG